MKAEEPLATLFLRNAEAQQTLTTQLGKQARRAIELLVQAIDDADRNAGHGTIDDRVASQAYGESNYSPPMVYEAAVTINMRLIFLLYAEERNLIGVATDD